MCRHLAFISSEPIALESMLVAPEHSLLEQARAPQLQSSGHDNPDGWGVGWYDTDGTVHRYRSARSIWDDPELSRLSRAVCTSAAMASVRLASPGSPVEETGNAPFTDGHWLFSLNGVVDRYHEGIGSELCELVTPRRAAGIEGVADSEVLFALALDRLDDGASPGAALEDVVREVVARTTGRLNLLLADGHRVAATAWGNSLFTLGATVIASEPLDAQAGWQAVPDRSLVELDGATLTVEEISAR